MHMCTLALHAPTHPRTLHTHTDCMHAQTARMHKPHIQSIFSLLNLVCWLTEIFEKEPVWFSSLPELELLLDGAMRSKSLEKQFEEKVIDTLITDLYMRDTLAILKSGLPLQRRGRVTQDTQNRVQALADLSIDDALQVSL